MKWYHVGALLLVWTFVVFSAGMFYSDYLAWQEALSRAALLPVEAPDPLPYNIPTAYFSDLLWWTEKTSVPLSTACRLFSTETSDSGTAEDPRWNATAVSWAGAKGLAQLMPGNLASPLFLSFNDGKAIDADDPHVAIKVGTRYLRWLYDQKGSWRLAVGAYNGGPARTSSKWVFETVRYVKRIMERLP